MSNNTQVLGYYGDLVTNNLRIGASKHSSNLSKSGGLLLKVNDTLDKGSLLVKIRFKTADAFCTVDLEFTNINGTKLSFIHKINNSNNYESVKINIASKYLNNLWEILILGSDINNTSTQILNVSYELLTPNVNGIYDAGDTPSVVIESNISKFSNGEEPSNWGSVSQPTILDLLPIGSIVAWYPYRPYDVDEIKEDPYDTINELTGGMWKICDGTEGTPDLRGRFIMGHGNTTTKNLTKIKSIINDGSVGDIEKPDTTTESLGIFNKDRLRNKEDDSATEGIKIENGIVNFGKIGNTGGSYLTKLLPKQQGSLIIGLREGENDNASDAPGICGAAFAWKCPADLPDDGFNTYEGSKFNSEKPDGDPKSVFGEDYQGKLQAKSRKKYGWRYGQVYLAEGASPHDNKPPYIVMAYIIKVK